MLTKILNNKGISIAEALMAAFLTGIAIISLLPMQDTSLRAGFRADYLGRAAGIMQSELELRENQIMIGTTLASTINQNIKVSGQDGAKGDAEFIVVTRTRVNPLAANSWIVNVQVTWTGGTADGITSSIIVTPQMKF